MEFSSFRMSGKFFFVTISSIISQEITETIQKSIKSPITYFIKKNLHKPKIFFRFETPGKRQSFAEETNRYMHTFSRPKLRFNNDSREKVM